MQRSQLQFFLLASVLCFAALVASPHSRADTESLEPFHATYAAVFRGMEAGNLTFTLKSADQPGRYIYETTADPSFLASLVVSRSAVERSLLMIDEKGVRPLEWKLDDGKSGDKGDGALSFDWSAQRVTGRIERESVDLPTQASLQDRLSIQIAVMVALLRGQEPGTIPMIDDNRVKQYTYTRKGTAALDTPLGSVETVIYESTRQGSSRVARFWMAPAHNFIPMRAEQERKGRVETVMTIKTLERGDEVMK